MAQHVDGHRRHAAELARQRPLGAFAVGQHAAEHARARRRARNLLDLLDAVDGEEADAERKGAGDVPLLLDGVAEGDTVSGCPRIKRHLDFGNRRGVEGRAHRSEQAQDLGRRVRFHRVIDSGIGESLLEGAEIVAHDVEVDDEARAIRTSGGEEVEDALGCHLVSPFAHWRAQASSCSRALGHADMQVKQRRDRSSWNQPVETPEP